MDSVGTPVIKMSKRAMDAEEKRWRAEADLRTLVEAEEIRADKARLKAAMKIRKEKLDAMKAAGDDD